jgi:hypothetical protein
MSLQAAYPRVCVHKVLRECNGVLLNGAALGHALGHNIHSVLLGIGGGLRNHKATAQTHYGWV